MWIRDRAQHHGVEDTEDGRGHPDTDCQRQDGYSGKSGTSPQRSNGEAQILPEVVQPGERSNPMMDLFGLCDSTEAA